MKNSLLVLRHRPLPDCDAYITGAAPRPLCDAQCPPDPCTSPAEN